MGGYGSPILTEDVMWFENKETGVKYEFDKEYAEKHLKDRPEMIECNDPTKKKKKAEAK